MIFTKFLKFIFKSFFLVFLIYYYGTIMCISYFKNSDKLNINERGMIMRSNYLGSLTTVENVDLSFFPSNILSKLNKLYFRYFDNLSYFSSKALNSCEKCSIKLFCVSCLMKSFKQFFLGISTILKNVVCLSTSAVAKAIPIGLTLSSFVRFKIQL